MMLKSLQEQYAPHNTCFGCGQNNPKGLKLKSFPEGNKGQVIASFEPESHHEAFPGILNGGIIGTLLDCHSNWTAAYNLMQEQEVSHPPCTVTSYFNVTLLKPTPSDKPVQLHANVLEISKDKNKAKIIAELYSEDVLCAKCEGLFVAVKPGHPAYHRW